MNRSYWPDAEATGQFLTELCEDLAATGEFDVHVLCGRPNHVAAEIDAETAQTTTRQGVTIHRVAHTRFAKRSLIGKLSNLTSFTAAAWWNSSRVPRPDIVVTETDPFFLGLLGRRLQKKLKCRFVAYLQDLYPDIAVACGMIREGAVVRTWRKALFGAYSRADRVVVLSRDMKERCVEHGVPESRLAIIPNWADTDGIRPIRNGNEFRGVQNLGDRFVVMYSGNMGTPHLLTPILDAAEQLKSREEIVFLFVGGGVQKEPLEAEAARRGLSNVRFLSYQPKEQLSHSLSAADVQIVSVKPGAIACLMPSKLYGILAAGCSVLAIAPEGSELADVVRDHAVGEVCDPAMEGGLGAAIAESLVRLLDREGLRARSSRARALAEAEYSRSTQVEKFRRMLLDVAGVNALGPSDSKSSSPSMVVDRKLVGNRR
jgi:glycosyltransferase involved in cell wall biosynthesis